ncbi:MAG: hypothetical protein KDK08_28490 [Rhizobiaceae bacterium]|nr:hypothetical protein [Rhizobiaceae bacterium]
MKRSDLPTYAVVVEPTDHRRYFLVRGAAIPFGEVTFEDNSDGEVDVVVRLPSQLIGTVEWSTLEEITEAERRERLTALAG